MHIDQEIKLDFSDVLIRPKRSTLTSRSEVDISRDFVFRHSGAKYHGIPISAANMDTTGTMEMARAFEPQQLSVALHKHYGEDDLVAFGPDARGAGEGCALPGAGDLPDAKQNDDHYCGGQDRRTEG